MRHYLLILVVSFYAVAHLWQYCGNKNKNPTTTMVIGYVVETAGFEPASRGPDTHLSTCVVY